MGGRELYRLDPSQEQAASHGRGAALVLAGPGSGKTRTLIERTVRLLQQEDPGRVTLVTFSVKAAGEMAARLSGRVARLPQIKTLHALALSLLMQTEHPPRVIDEEVEEGYRAEWQQQHGSEEGFEEWLAAEGLVSLRTLVPRALAALDDPALLQWARERCEWLLVDEFQDTDAEQLALLQKLCPPGGHFYAVGDANQQIYGWRGALPEVMERFVEAYQPVVYRLSRSYRSPESILKVARLVLPSPIAGSPGGAPPVWQVLDNPWAEAAWVVRIIQHEGFAPSEVAILVRSRQQIGPIEEALLKAGLPYALVGGVALEKRREVQAFLALLKLAVLDQPPVDLAARILPLVPGLGMAGLRRLLEAGGRLEEAMQSLKLPRVDLEQQRLVGGYIQWVRNVLQEIPREALPEVLEELLEGGRGLLMGYLEKLGNAPERWGRLQRLPLLAREWLERNDLEASFFPVSLFLGADASEGVRLSTIHAAKGLEWPVVFIPGLVQGVFPIGGEQTSLEEERRLLYVAITRAQERLFLSRFRFSLNGKPTQPSSLLPWEGEGDGIVLPKAA